MKKFVGFVTVPLLTAFWIGCSDQAVNPPEVSQIDQSEEKVNNTLFGTLDKKGSNFRANLSGDNTNATGQVILQFNEDDTQLYYKLIVANIQDVTAAHLYHAHDGEQTGHAALTLFSGTPSGPVDGILAEGILTADDITCTCPDHIGQHDLSHLKQHMIGGETYVNVHTVAYPDGEIRGWIR